LTHVWAIQASAAAVVLLLLHPPVAGVCGPRPLHDALPSCQSLSRELACSLHLVKQQPGPGGIDRGVMSGKLLERQARPTKSRREDRTSTRLNSSHARFSYAGFGSEKKVQSRPDIARNKTTR